MKPCFLVTDKPAGITSHDVVAMVRAITGVKKVGHTGTLDPFATGVLPLAVGAATRLIRFLKEDLKDYDATIALGSATDTGDPTGAVVREAAVPALEREAVLAALATFRGVRMQEPPRHSAIKRQGRPLYAYAREGKDVRAEPRPIRIDDIELVELSADRLRVVIRCGRGTYARVLADEIGQALGTAGHLAALRRLRSGPFDIERATDLSALSAIASGGDPDWPRVLRPARGADRVPWRPRSEVWAAIEARAIPLLEALSHLPRAMAGGEVTRRVIAGGPPPPPPPGCGAGDPFAVVDGDRLLAVATWSASGAQVVRAFGD